MEISNILADEELHLRISFVKITHKKAAKV